MAYSGVMEFDSPYQSYEYMAKMEQYFREKIAKEIDELWIDDAGLPQGIAFNLAIQKATAIARGQK